MAMNKLTTGLLLFVVIACAAGDSLPELVPEIKDNTEFELFQGYTLAACLAYGYQAGDIYTDSVAALNGYRARARVPLEAYRQLNKIIVNWLAKSYKNHMDEQTEIAACIDLSKSQELAQLFAIFDPCRDSRSWRDKNEFKVRCPQASSFEVISEG
ncbi:hypothetical protein SG34_014255 [Thalassomonas viridans]|uniref:Rap1a immunity protein domain-containing protein n=1 Tax=Thalassomonas viridans TaxID=137584 RepID=A0AAE9Z9S9_9GAMM|nr:hypothetical protein [Thalassomonas viridans]WDE07943.1 hypothetical protein SG34_014255 [Thalassomonas viridans]